jgi:anti-anti-sigma factor
MAITKTVRGETWEFLIPGRIDGAMANQLEEEVLAAMRAGAREILLNLSAAEWICSAGIRVVLQYHRQMKAAGKSLLVTRPSEAVDEILEMTGFRSAVVEGLDRRT